MFFETKRRKNAQITNFQVFGERSSGTNFTTNLIAHNLNILHTNVYGWKHGYPSMSSIARNTLAVVVFRAAVPWLKSIYSKPWHTTNAMRQLSFSDFIRAEWDSVADTKRLIQKKWPKESMRETLQVDRHPITGQRFRNVIELRNLKNACFLGMRHRDCNVALVQFEYVLQDQEAFLNTLADVFGLDFSGTVIPVEKHLGAGNFPKTRVAPAILPDSDIGFIRDNLSFEIEAQLGFRYDFQN